MSKSLNLPYLNILVAYPYMSKDMILALQKAKDTTEGRFRFLLDSGAFTAYNSGKTIKLDDYCKFIESLPFEPTGYFMLDVIGNPSATMKNYEIMLKRGFNPIPVFTRGEDFSVLEEFYKTSDYVALGGFGNVKGGLIPYIAQCMKIVNNRKVHLLGFTRLKYLRQFKPYSVDSSSWTSGRRFGTISIYNPIKFNFILYNGIRKNLTKKPDKILLREANKYGFNYKDLMKKSTYKGENSVLNILSLINYLKAFTDFEKRLNVKSYLAISDSNSVNRFLNIYNFLYKDGELKWTK